MATLLILKRSTGIRIGRTSALWKLPLNLLGQTDEIKAEVDQEIIAEENEILEREREAILADWRRYYSNKFDQDGSPLANLPIPIEVDSPPNSQAPSLNLSPKLRPMVRMKSMLDRMVKQATSSSIRSTLSASSPPNAPPSRSFTSPHPLTLQRRSCSFSLHEAPGFPVRASGQPAMGLARAATFATSGTREPISGRTQFKIRLGRQNSGTNLPEETHTSLSMPTGREDRTSEYQLTAEEIEGDLDMTVPEDELDEKDFIDLYECDEEDGNGSEDSDRIYGEEMIYEEEEEEVKEADDDSEEANHDNNHDDGELERSFDSLIQSEKGDVDMIGAGEISGSSLGRASRDLERSHSAPSTRELYSDVVEHRFRASTQEIGERLLGWAMTPMDFIISQEDQQDSIEHIITKRKRVFAGNSCLIIDLEAASREDAEEHGIDLEEIDRIDRAMDRQALLNLSLQQFPRPIKKDPEN
ncbi:hypothetical protein B9Z19DRAFT_1061793 [Tuber borchii]|uniref:Uncharacterized protein n=1 Tax=Tuber borchii TaxID=42251 RepID=A0A2T7A469_TUBBO|nr:hypothetical protein B9Z19DRAFT_1061793 [Tuber borchii]